MMMGQLRRNKKVTENDKEIIASMKLDKLTDKEEKLLDEAKKDFNFDNYVNAKIALLKKRNRWRPGMSRGMMQGVDFTNIAIMERFYCPQIQDNEREYAFKIYVTGSGTHSDMSKGMDISGLANGQGSAGVLQKVIDALYAIQTKTENIRNNDNIGNVHYKFDVFGFSRGATEARMFVDFCTIRDNRPSKIEKIINTANKKLFHLKISKKLKSKKIIFPKESKITFNVGIYDTVASVGVIRNSKWANPILADVVTAAEVSSSTATTYHDENVRDLGLNTLATALNVEKVVHICALDEFRENFALCALPNGGKVEQMFLPGCHTDIGGSEMSGYRDFVTIPFFYKSIKDSHQLRFRPISCESNIMDMTYENLREIGWIKDKNNADKGDKYIFPSHENKTINRFEPTVGMMEMLHRKKYIVSNENNVTEEELIESMTEIASDDAITISRYSDSGYSNLPLQIMAEKLNVFSNTIKGKHMIPQWLPQDFKEVQNNWLRCSNVYGDYFYPEKDKYKFLRQYYLHFSSDKGLVNGPYFNEGYCYDRLFYT